MTGHHLVVVPHTHWDREWYRSHESFRYRLVGILDELLELLERDPGFRRFTLDGQMIALDDYLEVRPAARERVEKWVREGRLVIGPWYVLPDEWLVSAEALIRNLRLGLEKARALGGGMQLGYVPDQFGHVGQLPQLFAGFGFETAALWRGVGADVAETCFTWEAPDGTRIFTLYLVQGYGNAGGLPLDPAELAQRLQGACAGQKPHSRIPTLLLMNGGDHAPPQPGLPQALASAVAQLDGVTAEIGALPDFAARARAEAPQDRPVHRGELRSGLRAPLLEGCASARLPLKRADFENDRLLTRWLEPLATWLGALGGDPDPAILELAWRVALENHPHDSICGCSIDPVHEAMETRFARVADLAGEHLRRVTRELGALVAPPARSGADRGVGHLVVWNPHAGGVAAAEGCVQLDAPERSALRLVGAGGRRLPVHAEEVEPAAIAARYEVPPAVAAALAGGFPPEFSGEWARDLVVRREGGRRVVEIQLGRDPRPGFDLAAARAGLAEELADPARPDELVEFRVRRLPVLRLRFVDDLPGCGLRSYRIERGRAEPEGSHLDAGRTGDGGAWIENDAFRVEVAADGGVCWIDRRDGCRVEDALRLVSEGDRGDEYTFDPVPGAPRVERPARARVRLARRSEAEVAIVVEARYRVPAALAPDRSARTRRTVSLPARLTLRLARGLARLCVALDVTNTAEDHRLRLHARAPFEAERFEVESAFEVAERPIDPEPDSFGSDRPAERPTGATPQRGFATLAAGGRAFSVANRGAPEVEAVREPAGGTSLAVSVLRAVGWLSRDDLAMRPGHAGPGLATPAAQVPGPHRIELSLYTHPDADPLRVAEAHRFAAPALVFAAAGDGEAPLADGARLLELDDPAVVVSAIEPRADAGALLRLYNASPDARQVRLRWNGPGARGLEGVDLAGRPAPTLALAASEGPAARLALRGWQLASLRPR